MGRSEPGGEKERQLARNATKVIAAGRRGGRRACDWRPFNEKRLNQARTGLFIQNLSETEHAGDYKRVGIFILESPKDLGRLYQMSPMRTSSTSYSAFIFLTSLINVICNLFCCLTLRLSTNMTIICSQLLSIRS